MAPSFLMAPLSTPPRAAASDSASTPSAHRLAVASMSPHPGRETTNAMKSSRASASSSLKGNPPLFAAARIGLHTRVKRWRRRKRRRFNTWSSSRWSSRSSCYDIFVVDRGHFRRGYHDIFVVVTAPRCTTVLSWFSGLDGPEPGAQDVAAALAELAGVGVGRDDPPLPDQFGDEARDGPLGAALVARPADVVGEGRVRRPALAAAVVGPAVDGQHQNLGGLAQGRRAEDRRLIGEEARLAALDAPGRPFPAAHAPPPTRMRLSRTRPAATAALS